jgi:hypothetical protein
LPGGPIVTAVVGGAAIAIFALLALVFAYDTHALRDRGLEAEAAVLDKSGHDPERITVRFTTRDGRVVQDDTEWYVDHDPAVRPGDTIRVVYDPADPHTFQDVRWGKDYMMAVIFALSAIGLAAFLVRDVRRQLPHSS